MFTRLILKRSFHSKNSKLFQRSSEASAGTSVIGKRPRNKDSIPAPAQLTGHLGKDGLTRYDLDFLETAEFTKGLIESMKQDAQWLKGGLISFACVLQKIRI
jgi:hypothetical protein